MKKIIYMSGLVLAMSLALIACSDQWNDHYEVKESSSGNGTIWEVISTDPELSNFSDVIAQCGYSSLLSSMQSFTLFAPTNSNFTPEMRDNIIAMYHAQEAATRAGSSKELRNEAVIKFIYNHLARYRYSINEGTDTMVNMMNGKKLLLTDNSIDGCTFEKTNIKTGNGVVYYINEPLTFKPNIYEYITSTSDKDSDLDSLYTFMTNPRFCFYEFDAKSSVPGDIVDGKTQYLDSVTVLRNTLLDSWYGAELNNEDSTYYLVAPTNTLWKEKLERYKKFFKYDYTDTDISQDLRDSLEYCFPRLCIILGTAFSKTVNGDEAIKDSAVSTNAVSYKYRYMAYGSYDAKYYQYDKPYAEGGIFNGTTEKKCSNGTLLKANTLNAKDKERFMQTITIPAASSSYLDSVYSASTSAPAYYEVSPESPFYNKLSFHSYVVISPKSGSQRQQFQYHGGAVLSGVNYKVYLLMAPAISGDTLDTKNNKGTIFRVQIKYRNEGTQKETTLSPQENPKSTYVQIDQSKNPITDVEKVFLGTYKFDYTSQGIDSRVRILFTNRSGSTNIEDKRMRISAIIFEPEEEE